MTRSLRERVRARLRAPWTRRRSSQRILAIASGGGHWVELLRLRPAFEGHEVIYATVSEAYRAQLAPNARVRIVQDATRWDRVALVACALGVLRVCLEERPDVVISTGALPGYFGLLFGKMQGARTIWVDSIANVEELSMSGQKAKRFADLWLTQWPELATPEGPEYAGAIL